MTADQPRHGDRRAAGDHARYPRDRIYLAKKKADNALADMKIVLGDDVEPDRLFHRARAYYLAGRRDKAAEAIAAARKAGLKPSVLEPYERPIYERLRENLR